MRTLTEREQRTIRFAGIFIGAYLAVYCAYIGWSYLESKRASYRALVRQAHDFKEGLLPYETRTLVVKKLMDDFHMDPAKLSRASVVAEASAAIQQAAAAGGIQVGPIRESPGRAAGQELASMQFEGTGQISAVVSLLSRMETLGYPLIIDSVQLTPDAMRPGQMKVSLTIIILDFEQWKGDQASHA